MPVAEIFRVNYYVGALLAQGGNLWIDGSKIIFSPTSTLDRAMGAEDVQIPFQHIRAVDYAGALSRSFNIKTDEKIHKFEGAQARKFWDLLEKVLPNKELMAPLGAVQKRSDVLVKPLTSLVCDRCTKPLQSGYSFCPHCGTRPKSACSSCRRTIDLSWAVCAFCGWKFTANSQNHTPES